MKKGIPNYRGKTNYNCWQIHASSDIASKTTAMLRDMIKILLVGNYVQKNKCWKRGTCQCINLSTCMDKQIS
jgi:hypothetical protein